MAAGGIRVKFAMIDTSMGGMIIWWNKGEIVVINMSVGWDKVE